MEACITGQTLCWRCRRATNAPGMGCSWSRRADPEPVEGWEARETTLKGSNYYHGKNYTTIIQSYVIRACPLFLPDEKNEPPRIYRKWIVEVDGEWLTTQETRERLGIDSFGDDLMLPLVSMMPRRHARAAHRASAS